MNRFGFGDFNTSDTIWKLVLNDKKMVELGENLEWISELDTQLQRKH